jgi:glutathione S-transferase
MPKVVLHQFPYSHYCIRLRWALGLKGIVFDSVNYTPNTVDRVEKLSGGWRMVPVLEWYGQFVTDSPKIARFIEAKQPKPTLYPGIATPALCDMINGWADVKVMLTAAKYFIGDLLNGLPDQSLREHYTQRFQTVHGLTVEEAIKNKENYEKDLNQIWATLDDSLSKQTYLLGNEVSYADLGVASRLGLMDFFAKYQVPENFLHVRRWYARIAKL